VEPPRWTPLPNNLQDLLRVLTAARRDLLERQDFERAIVVSDLAHELAELIVRAHRVLNPQEHGRSVDTLDL